MIQYLFSVVTNPYNLVPAFCLGVILAALRRHAYHPLLESVADYDYPNSPPFHAMLVGLAGMVMACIWGLVTGDSFEGKGSYAALLPLAVVYMLLIHAYWWAKGHWWMKRLTFNSRWDKNLEKQVEELHASVQASASTYRRLYRLSKKQRERRGLEQEFRQLGKVLSEARKLYKIGPTLASAARTNARSHSALAGSIGQILQTDPEYKPRALKAVKDEVSA